MTYINSRAEQGAEEGGMVVHRPRVTDAIGAALRNAFGPQVRLPAEWEASLRRLDRR